MPAGIVRMGFYGGSSMKRFAVFVVLVMVVIGSCAAQSASNNAQSLVGTWISEKNSSDTVTFVFNANGTGTHNGENIFWGVSVSGLLYYCIQEWTSQNFNGTYFLSPDGKRLIFSSRVFQKK